MSKNRRNKHVNYSQLLCLSCKNLVYNIPRNYGQREIGHIKDLYCPWCKKVTKCQEYRSDIAYQNMAGEILSI